MAETTYERGPHKGFTTVYNSAARDPRLSLAARGLFLTMESLPPDWRYSEAGLCRLCQCGRTRIRSALNELKEAGYLTRQTRHTDKGRFAGEVYVLLQESACPVPEPVSENPTAENTQPLSRFPTADNPTSENRTVQNKDIQNKDIQTPLTPQGAGRGDEDEMFARFWARYPKKRGKRDALRAWKALAPDMALCRKMSAALKTQMQSAQWQKDNGKFIPYPTTWLRGRRWEDDYSDGAPVGFDETPPDDDGETEDWGWQA